MRLVSLYVVKSLPGSRQYGDLALGEHGHRGVQGAEHTGLLSREDREATENRSTGATNRGISTCCRQHRRGDGY